MCALLKLLRTRASTQRWLSSLQLRLRGACAAVCQLMLDRENRLHVLHRPPW